jgi:hypothetical protein
MAPGQLSAVVGLMEINPRLIQFALKFFFSLSFPLTA